MNSELFLDIPCLIERSLQSVGDQWSILILRDAHSGIRRFDEFRKSLGIAPTILTKRLAMLTETGLLEKKRYSERPPRDEYLLTEAGIDFLPVLFMIGAWGRKHRAGGNVVRFYDALAGTEIDAIAIDKATGSPIGSREIRVVLPD
ncbi:winged helix-turn-helix transcriptional regulator [Pseudomonas fluorescens]|uniref:winged helix-turn-helix transcriptional regulator n=1 Tax=Pseudomonas fluorescens TaxID=294 RepID=UPI001BEB2E2F|nr:helix-turn-helix domain-containing protein [Pseudomonas fluorescens]MBT2370790.1 helix-turn-helix transcriptional regulator [Pseudomonas fluorescens]